MPRPDPRSRRALRATVAALALAAPVAAQEPRVFMSCENADVGAVLATIARISRIEVTVAPGVAGKVAIRLRDVPAREAVEAVAAKVGCVVAERDDGTLCVHAADPEVRRRTAEYSKAVEAVAAAARALESSGDPDAALKALDEADRALMRARLALWKVIEAQREGAAPKPSGVR